MEACDVIYIALFDPVVSCVFYQPHVLNHPCFGVYDFEGVLFTQMEWKTTFSFFLNLLHL